MYKNLQENALIDLLRQVKEVLDKHNVEFWLDCGTLLGAIREGKFLSWEHDIDFGAWHEKVSDNVKKSVARELSDSGFKLYIAKDYINYISIKNGEVVLDINFYCLNNDKAIMLRLTPKNLIGKYLIIFLQVLLSPYYYEIDFRNKSRIFVRSILIVISRVLPSLLRKRIAKIILLTYKKIGSKDVSWVVPNKYFTDLLTMRFYEMDFKVPVQTEEYLIYRYGKKWRVPNKEWVTERDDGSVINSLS